ncbi:MAG: restriction endonuclease subunit S [Thermotogae bacterium]|nr:restriction endonuclease subunit S [Thermotogota bacterium]
MALFKFMFGKRKRSPHDIREIKLEDIAVIIMGQSPPSSSYNEDGEGVPFIQGKAEFGRIYPTPRLYTTRPIKIANPEDILISVRAPVGDVNIANKKICIGRGIAAIRVDKKLADPVYVFYFLQLIKPKVEAKASGSTFKAIRYRELAELRIKLPPLLEQKKIAEILRTVDEAIEKTDEAIERTERLKKGLMQRLLTRGIKHERFKKTELGEIPEEWRVVGLEDAAIEVTIGVVSSATPYYTSQENGVPYFRSQNVRENKLLPTNIYITKEFNERHKKSILKEGDVLTVQTGDIGTSCVVPKEFEGSNCHSLLITRTNPQMLNPYFLSYFLNSHIGKTMIKRINSGWGRDHLLLKDFRKLKILLPPIEEQKQIAEIISTVDRKLELLRGRKEKLERVKRGLMKDLLMGRKRVKAWSK